MSDKFRVTRYKTTLSLTHAGAATTVSNTSVMLNGVLRHAIVKSPATVDASATLTLNIIDQDSVTVYTKAAIAANTTSNNLLTQDLSVPLSGFYTVQIVFSAAQTVTDTATDVILLVDRG